MLALNGRPHFDYIIKGKLLYCINVWALALALCPMSVVGAVQKQGSFLFQWFPDLADVFRAMPTVIGETWTHRRTSNLEMYCMTDWSCAQWQVTGLISEKLACCITIYIYRSAWALALALSPLNFPFQFPVFIVNNTDRGLGYDFSQQGYT